MTETTAIGEQPWALHARTANRYELLRLRCRTSALVEFAGSVPIEANVVPLNSSSSKSLSSFDASVHASVTFRCLIDCAMRFVGAAGPARSVVADVSFEYPVNRPVAIDCALTR